MDILEKIVISKKQALPAIKEAANVRCLEKSPLFGRECYDLPRFLKDETRTGVIAEFKRKSPSKGFIYEGAKVEDVVPFYQKGGASAVSVLSDTEFFGGCNDDVRAARNLLEIPVLRKDFIVDEYQVVEAKAIGADVILLIAAALEPKKLRMLASLAKSLGLSVLMEVHGREELLDNMHDEIDAFGVNNRNLKTFEVSLDVSRELAPLLPKERMAVSESGIRSVEDILELRKYGYRGFLIGENFMKNKEGAGESAFEFLQKLKVSI